MVQSRLQFVGPEKGAIQLSTRFMGAPFRLHSPLYRFMGNVEKLVDTLDRGGYKSHKGGADPKPMIAITSWRLLEKSVNFAVAKALPTGIVHDTPNPGES